MPTKKSTTGSELFIVDNSDADWKALQVVLANFVFDCASLGFLLRPLREVAILSRGCRLATVM